MMEPDEIWQALKEQGGDTFSHVTISGGNPALIKQVGELVKLLHEHNVQVALETQGSRWQSWFTEIDELTLSPKPPSSGMQTNFDILDQIIQSLQDEQKGNFSLKIVVFDEQDLSYAIDVYKRYSNVRFFLQVGNNDLSNLDDQQLLAHLLERYQWLIDKVMKSEELKNVRVLPQLHTYLWGNKRSV